MKDFRPWAMENLCSNILSHHFLHAAWHGLLLSNLIMSWGQLSLCFHLAPLGLGVQYHDGCQMSQTEKLLAMQQLAKICTSPVGASRC